MSRILADMTPAERAECVGMWCETSSPRGLGILARLDDGYQDATVLHVDSGDSWCHGLAEVTPRFDLPRAWTPDGEPVEMEAEFGEVAQGRAWLDGLHNTGLTRLPAGPIRRHVTDWEEA